ncbi:MAG: cellulase family glycosylhydrolase [Planctomycetes bacterium]|nr:cellulase family glycosylhydrolase [Planctomycetota bacterium]
MVLAVAATVAMAACAPSGGGGGPQAALATARGGAAVPGASAAAGVAPAAGWLRVEGRFLRDAAGRAVILRGLNVAASAKEAPYLPWQTEADLDRLAGWGFDAVRLLLQWRAIEPDPGRIDQAYLDQVALRVRWLADRGVWVVLDMHQDVYGGRYGGNGAPDWASPVPPVIPPALLSGLPWFVHYGKPEVVAAYDLFWANAPAPDGVGLQDHLAQAWSAVARRFRGEAAVAGYDLYNEPYYGSDVVRLPAAVLQADPLVAFKLHRLSDPPVLAPLLAAMGGPHGAFERSKLAPFYARVMAALRAEDPDHVVFLEPAALSNMGIPTGLPRPLDPQTALIPHYYDPQAQDGQRPYDGDARRMDAALGALASVWDAPMVLGEFGNMPDGLAGNRDYLRDLHAALDRHFAGGMWWEWGPALAARGDLDGLTRAYPRRVPGAPLDLRFDPATSVLELRHTTGPSDRAPLEIALPAARYPRGVRVDSSDPTGAWTMDHDAIRGILTVHHDPSRPLHSIRVSPR